MNQHMLKPKRITGSINQLVQDSASILRFETQSTQVFHDRIRAMGPTKSQFDGMNSHN